MSALAARIEASAARRMEIRGADLVAVTALAAVLRFVGLAHQSLWYDEAFTSYLVHYRPGVMLSLVRHVESTPPLYYCVAWVWTRVFGMGAAGLRSLSAVAGTLLVPVAYGIGAVAAGRRAALALAALCATCPLLVWYSQEARSYSMLALLGGLSMLTWLRARDRLDRRWLAAWAVASVLALLTHYYAVVLVVPEALWLVVEHRRRAAAWIAAAAPFVVGAVLLPLAVAQRDSGLSDWIPMEGLGFRMRQVGRHFLTGFSAPVALTALAAVLVAVALTVALRGRPPAPRTARTGLALGLGGLGLALVLAAGGQDNVITRNVIVTWLPLASAVAAAASTSRRLGPAAIAGLCAIGSAAVVLVGVDAHRQKPAWRQVSAALGPPRRPRLILTEDEGGILPLAVYQPHVQRMPMRGAVPVSEVDVVAGHGAHGRFCWWGAQCNIPRGVLPAHAPPGLAGARRTSFAVPGLRVARFVAPAPVPLRRGAVLRWTPHFSKTAVLYQR